MAFKFLFFSALVAVANAGLLATPTYTTQDQNILRSHGNLGQISTYSKTIDTPYSSVSKSDVRISNPGLAVASPFGYHGAQVAQVASPLAYQTAAIAAPLGYHGAQVASPLAYQSAAIAAPLGYHGAQVASPLAYQAAPLGYHGAQLAAPLGVAKVAAAPALLGVAYSAAPAVSHMTYSNGLGLAYSW